ATTCARSLHTYAKMREIAQRPGPLTHAFVIGMGELGVQLMGHWTALILEKDKDGNHTWYGCDSWGNQTSILPQAINYVDQLLKNSLEDKQALEIYSKFISREFYKNNI